MKNEIIFIYFQLLIFMFLFLLV